MAPRTANHHSVEHADNAPYEHYGRSKDGCEIHGDPEHEESSGKRPKKRRNCIIIRANGTRRNVHDRHNSER